MVCRTETRASTPRPAWAVSTPADVWASLIARAFSRSPVSPPTIVYHPRPLTTHDRSPPTTQPPQHHSRQASSVGRVREQGSVALNLTDQPSKRGRRRERRGRPHAQRTPYAAWEIPALAPAQARRQTLALEQGRAGDDRQRRVTRQSVRVHPVEAPGPRGGQGGAVARHARDQGRGLGQAQGQPVHRSRLLPPARGPAPPVRGGHPHRPRQP